MATLPGVKKAFVASGIRYDLILADKTGGGPYLQELVDRHVSGQLKIAPEHMEDHILALMGKPTNAGLVEFKQRFDRLSAQARKRQFLTYYFIAAHPGCNLADMRKLGGFVRRELQLNPEQVQIFTPTPSTFATLMYHTGRDPFTGRKVYVEKRTRSKIDQKEALMKKNRTVSKKSGRRKKTRPKT